MNASLSLSKVAMTAQRNPKLNVRFVHTGQAILMARSGASSPLPHPPPHRRQHIPRQSRIVGAGGLHRRAAISVAPAAIAVPVLRRAHRAQPPAFGACQPQLAASPPPGFRRAENAPPRMDAGVAPCRLAQPVDPLRLDNHVGQEQVQFAQAIADQPGGHRAAPPCRRVGAQAARHAIGQKRRRPLDPVQLAGQGGVRVGQFSSPIRSAAMKASCGIWTDPYSRIRFLPSFCLSSSFFLRLMSPP